MVALQNGTCLPSKEFHIFGNGISFSISPTIHNAGFQHDGLPFVYDIRESASIDDVAELIGSDSFGGGSVTMPHKLHVHKYCDRLTETARHIGAINTLVVSTDGGQRIITGDNTDWSGLCSIMNAYIKKAKELPRSGLVIGAGGASRAALYALHRAGVKTIYLSNRTLSAAEAARDTFADQFAITVLRSLDDMPKPPDIIVGTVPADKTTEEQFANLFGPAGLCIDMAYKPRKTPLLAVAQRHPGWETVTGIQVLLAQAFDQYRLWTGNEPPKNAMVDAVTVREGGAEQIISIV
ncbi:hypothetical protein SBRCBS47491_005116 [Sporothrix bragantina]|uniref:Shikimate dehydrogenase substrate binding N-terminal domain-containing protein n=1 Tax=Sporothrix bragantina TaxID=671064 RepID=A0ABP0BW00_9PEZI